jgi:hypothetical protein
MPILAYRPLTWEIYGPSGQRLPSPNTHVLRRNEITNNVFPCINIAHMSVYCVTIRSFPQRIPSGPNIHYSDINRTSAQRPPPSCIRSVARLDQLHTNVSFGKARSSTHLPSLPQLDHTQMFTSAQRRRSHTCFTFQATRSITHTQSLAQLEHLQLSTSAQQTRSHTYVLIRTTRFIAHVLKLAQLYHTQSFTSTQKLRSHIYVTSN